MKRALFFDALIDDLEYGSPEEEAPVKSFDDFVEKLETHLVPLNYTYSMIQLLSTASSDTFDFPILDQVAKMYERVRQRRFQSLRIYEHMKKVPEDVEKDRFKMRLVSKYLLHSRMNALGVGPEERHSFTRISEELSKKTGEFTSNLDRANRLVREFMDSASVLPTLPDDFDVRDVSLGDDIGPQKFLENCSDRLIRSNFYRNLYKRAMKGAYNNSVVIEEIREHRKDQAKMLGFDNFLTMSLEGRMAGSVDNIRAMINTLHLRSAKAFENDLQELTELAVKDLSKTSSKEPKEEKFDKIQLWDLDYYMKRAVEDKESSVISIPSKADNFTYESSLNAVFNLFKRLFQVEIQEVPKGAFQSWDPNVRLFDIVSSKGHHGSFYLDSFSRPGKKLDVFSSTHLLVSRSEKAKTKPLSAVLLNLPKSDIEGQDIPLSFPDVVKLFGSFGAVLLHSMTQVPFSEINGLQNLEWDALRVVPEFLQYWPQYDLQTLKDCSQTDVSFESQESLVKNLHRFSAVHLRRNIYKSAIDLSIHSNDIFWGEIVPEVWETYMKPFELEKMDCHLCQSVDIMCRYPCSIYTPLWSKILAADLFSIFQDNSNQDVSPLGMQFRDYFLAQSGGCSSAQLFKSFTERNPSVEGYLKLNRSCMMFD